MIIFLELLMVAAVLLFIGRPIFILENDPSALVTAEDEYKEDLLQKKEYAFETLSDLDLDFKTGKISEEDFKTLKKRYEHEAISVLKEIDQLGRPGKQGTKKVPVTASEKQKGDTVSSEVSKQARFCTHCGGKAESADNFCNQCGQKL